LGGNSLLDVLVFGRIAGRNAALYAKKRAKDGQFTLDHVRTFHKELEDNGIDRQKVSPVLLPDYSNPLVRQRQLTTHYQGTIR
jgi:succinate dehydrogenase/fumarate reductase flavoprotein subunit